MSSPSIPDQNKAAMEGIKADLANYPFKSIIDAAAQMGKKVTVGGKTYDFSGLGNADVNAATSDKTAKAILDIQRKYGPEFVAQRLKDLEQANPNGTAARKELASRILTDAQAKPNRPAAEAAQQTILDQLSQGGSLGSGPGSEKEAVQQGVRGGQIARGNFLGNAAASQEAGAVEQAGDAAQRSRQQTAMTFLSSGVSPEDAEYRRIQQSLSNLSNFANGTSPIAEFSSLSGAQSGAAPFTTGTISTPSLDPNAGVKNMERVSGMYSGKVNWAASQANPWTVGLSLGASGANLMASAGRANSTSYYTPQGIYGVNYGQDASQGALALAQQPQVTSSEL